MTLTQQRVAAEERASALLRSIVPEEEWRWEVRPIVGSPTIRGRWFTCLERMPSHLEFLGQSGRFKYQIHFSSTSENITRISIDGRVNGLCGGPFAWNDYILPNTRGVDPLSMRRARDEAIAQHTTPLSLPRSDIWLGQYLALKYDEKEFLEYANLF